MMYSQDQGGHTWSLCMDKQRKNFSKESERMNQICNETQRWAMNSPAETERVACSSWHFLFPFGALGRLGCTSYLRFIRHPCILTNSHLLPKPDLKITYNQWIPSEGSVMSPRMFSHISLDLDTVFCPIHFPSMCLWQISVSLLKSFCNVHFFIWNSGLPFFKETKKKFRNLCVS